MSEWPLILFKLASVACSPSGATKLHFILLWRIHCWWQDVLQIIITSKVEYVKQVCLGEITHDVIVVWTVRVNGSLGWVHCRTDRLILCCLFLNEPSDLVSNPSWVDIWFSPASSESFAFLTSRLKSRPSFTFREERPGDAIPVREQASPH